MELSKNFDHSIAESKWYKHWLDKGYFHSEPDDRESYTVVIPPPNVTGVLHMGHCLNNTIQDILVRHARMQGKNACWVPGTDHASIATEAKVVQMLREKGINKSNLSREEFLKYAWEWKEKYGGIILQQLKKLGCSLDWDRTTFTMDPDYYQSVINVFIDLYKKGYIYRGKRMINWDVKAKTALSDEEVIRKETKQKLYYLKYFIANTKDYITIATVRPETIMGDTAVCVHPSDERYKHLHGKSVLVPLINRRIPVITDEYVTMDFGTGALKVTPAHDMNDYQLGQKHNLEIIDIFNDNGTLNSEAQILIGEERFEARKKIVKLLEEENYIDKIEDYTSEVGYSERTDAVVEPRLSLQWWVAMKKISGPALNAVINENDPDNKIDFHPAKFKNLYRHWMENIRDWCISRQLWWGQRIPAWYAPDGSFAVAATKEEAFEQLTIKNSNLKIDEIAQDEDVLDTWFSSWLWPFEVFKGYSNPGNKDVKYYYPTQTLVTAPEIIFFWVARMIMSGFEYMHQKPFRDVYFTGIVRDKLGRKMSKSLGNSPDLLQMIDDDGADAVRFGIMIASPAGNDLMWDPAGNEQGRFFINKIWNALKLVKMWESRQAVSNGPTGETESNFAVDWFKNRLNEVKAELNGLFKDFRLSEALKTIYSLIWDDFCSWYLEWIKPKPEETIDTNVYQKTILYFEELMKLLHPFMPFVTEEVYHLLKERTKGDDIVISLLKTNVIADTNILNAGEILKKDISTIRDIRKKFNIKNIEQIKYSRNAAGDRIYNGNQGRFPLGMAELLEKQTNIQYKTPVEILDNKIPASEFTVVSDDRQFYLQTQMAVDTSSQKEQLIKDLEYQKGFLASVEKKLSNERFVQNAKPEIVEVEKKKKADAEAKIKAIEESLSLL
ncbi:MAG: valine--tRNA ligase [Bacteroidetes bacterium]|nr:valine--tRNA ligase [Bacteroidota bacterium]